MQSHVIAGYASVWDVNEIHYYYYYSKKGVRWYELFFSEFNVVQVV